MGHAEMVAQYGCPLGTLARSSTSATTVSTARPPSCSLIAWAEDQFREMGRRDARDLAVTLIAAFQGAALLTNTFRDPQILSGNRAG